ncbi:MAG: AbrB/MazE/SpoVT family DNA-binding domain-containing protein [Egibacteraceae bacterium]
MDANTLRLDPQGRVVIPKALRERLGFGDGIELHARAEPGRLVLETREAIVARMRAEARGVDPGRSMVEELIADRRQQARREHGDA